MREWVGQKFMTSRVDNSKASQRGHSLYLIAQVSSLDIKSRARSSWNTYQKQIVEGQVIFSGRTSTSSSFMGTDIHVSNLFRMLPVRQKTLQRQRMKTLTTIRSFCQETVFFFPHIAVEIYTKAKMFLHLPATSSLLDRLCQVLDPEIIPQLKSIEAKEPLCFTGYYAIVPLQPRWSGLQYIFINQRWCNRVETFRRIIQYEWNTQRRVTVENFRRTTRPWALVLVLNCHLGASEYHVTRSVDRAEIWIERPEWWQDRLRHWMKDFILPQVPEATPRAWTDVSLHHQCFPTPINTFTHTQEEQQQQQPAPHTSLMSLGNHNTRKNTFSISKSSLREFQFLYQVDNKYIFVIDHRSSTLYCIDQHAADERIRLEALECQYREATTVDVLELETPVEIHGLENMLLHLEEPQHAQLSHWGFVYSIRDGSSGSKNKKLKTHDSTMSYRHGSSRTWQWRQDSPTSSSSMIVILHQVPVIEGRVATKENFQQFVQSLASDSALISTVMDLPTFVHHILKSKACRGAIMFGDPLTEYECQEILDGLRTCNFPFQCAHGRPSIVPLIQMHTSMTSWRH